MLTKSDSDLTKLESDLTKLDSDLTKTESDLTKQPSPSFKYAKTPVLRLKWSFSLDFAEF